MLLGVRAAVSRISGAATNARAAAAEGKQRQTAQTANLAAGLQVDSGLISVSGQEWARYDLLIPAAMFPTSGASQVGLPRIAMQEAAALLVTAQELLVKAEQAYTAAMSNAGFSASASHTAMATVMGLTPIVSKLSSNLAGGQNRHISKGQQHMQVVEQHMAEIGRLLFSILAHTHMTEAIQAPKQPLALTELLAALSPSSSVTLPASRHPVVAVLVHAEMNAPHESANTQAAAPRRRQRRQGLLTRLAASGDEGQAEKLAMAQAIAGRVCVADLLELQRLTAQLQQMQHWLNS